MSDKLSKILITLFIFIYPLFYLPFTLERYETSKMFLVVFFPLLMLFIISLKTALTGKLKIRFDLTGFSLVLLSVVSVISLFLRHPNIIVGLISPMSASTLVSSTLLYFIFLTLPHRNEKEYLSAALVLASLFIGIFRMLAVLKIIPDPTFTPAGSIFNTALFLFSVCFFISMKCFHCLVSTKADEKPVNYILFYSVSFLILLPITVFSVYGLFTSQKPVILPYEAGWSILLDIFKDPKTLFLGIGPSNFITAFTFFRPVWLNSSPFWNVTFSSSSSFLFTLVSETGITAVLVFLLLFISGIKRLYASLRKHTDHGSGDFPYALTSLFILFIMILFPASVPLFTTFIMMSALGSASGQKTLVFEKTRPVLFIFVLFFLLILSTAGYFGGKIYLAEVRFTQSEKVLSEGKINESYDLMKSAVTLNPYHYKYRIAFSQVSLALANGISVQNDQNEDSRKKASELIAQSLDEAKNGVALYKTNVIAWDNLVMIYSSLINIAKGAENWAIETQKQKITLDPSNPSNRLYLGGIYYSQNNYVEAEKLYREAVALKNDFSNAHFNLALALIGQKKHDEAYKELLVTQQYTASGSADREIVDKEIEKLLKEYIPSTGQ